MRLYEIPIVIHSGKLKQINVIASCWHNALKIARIKTEYDHRCYQAFKQEWYYTKQYIVDLSYCEFFTVKELHHFFKEAFVRVFENLDCSVDGSMNIFDRIRSVYKTLLDERMRGKNK